MVRVQSGSAFDFSALLPRAHDAFDSVVAQAPQVLVKAAQAQREEVFKPEQRNTRRVVHKEAVFTDVYSRKVYEGKLPPLHQVEELLHKALARHWTTEASVIPDRPARVVTGMRFSLAVVPKPMSCSLTAPASAHAFLRTPATPGEILGFMTSNSSSSRLAVSLCTSDLTLGS